MRAFPPFRLDTGNQCLWRGDGLAEERLLLAPKALPYRSLGRSTVLALANSLVDYERPRNTFLEAPPVRAIIDAGR